MSKYIAKMGNSKPRPPTANDIEAYCTDQQQRIDLLLAEAATLRACEQEQECAVEEAGAKVQWTDIDGNTATDAAWLTKRIGVNRRDMSSLSDNKIL